MIRLPKALYLVVGLSMLAASGCSAHGGAEVAVAAPAPSATLVAVSPGIWVVENHEHPVFFVDDVYWRYNSGVWHRRGHWTGAWVRVRVASVPHRVLRIERPNRYRLYRAKPGVRRRAIKRRAVRKHRRGKRK